MIPIVRPELGEEEKAAALGAIESGWVSSGPRSAEFERAVAEAVGVSRGVAVNSCTNAILLTLIALGVRPGDEIVVPAFTCVAAVNPIELLGATPVLVDVELEAFGITEAALERVLTPRTRGVIFAHLFGLAADVGPIARLCRDRGLWLMEDIALGFGAMDGGRAVGSFGDAAVLSFHPRKLITTGEGGMVVTGAGPLADTVTALRNYGAARPAWDRHNHRLFDLPEYHHAGLNCKLTDIQGAIGVEQAKRVPALIARRTEIARRYSEAFTDLTWLDVPAPRPGTTPAWQSYVVTVGRTLHANELARAARNRDCLLEHLYAAGVSAVQGAQAMHGIAYYAEKYAWPASAFPNAERADRTTLCLPIFAALSDADQGTVIEAVRAFGPA